MPSAPVFADGFRKVRLAEVHLKLDAEYAADPSGDIDASGEISV